jgi:hypothetical protein
MAGIILPYGADPESYQGLPTLYEFVNSDGSLTRFNCGQAAACTLLAHCGAATVADVETACSLMGAIEEAHPPDNFGGWFGTSRRRVERICHAHGIQLEEVSSEAELRAALVADRPVAVLVQLPGPKVWGFRIPVGHWMVAYGYDEDQIFLTNYDSPGMPWDDFRRAWGGLLGRFMSMRNTGLVPVRND